jgi:hypothetical protein
LTPVPEYSDGARQCVFYDTDARLSRLLRVAPGVRTDEVAVHDYHEEVLILEGGLVDLGLEEAFTAGMYAYRTPGMEHGPYDYPVGCLMFEHRYADAGEPGEADW